ncbi:MAG TPA: sigma-70 family RNA polymerase sigma factor [Planctomycetota bacterium]|nr:sigma-70 family RNA polymerase sigma factor [Planctomycetota bacterium]
MDELIGGLQAGRPEAFERLVREYGDRIYRFVKRLAGERSAEDLTQEVLIRIHRSIESYRPEGRFESWLFTIANHLCIDHARRRKPEATLSELDGGFAPDRFAAATLGPLESMEDEERRRAILAAVDRLPFEQRQVFLLREEAGMSFREIAEAAGCPLNTALGRMHYAMEALRKSLKAYGMQ